ncbi:MAG TPA: nitrite/sulfite reductase [Acidimicrobiales bacterium]|nr:nitrite/sulfite reductase [Acidimicrobiales bacterium]
MAAPDIPAAKRAGLPVDLDRLAAEGDGWLSPEDRYALKTWGVCTQLQDHVFMVRVRVPGGVLPTAQARAVARLAARHGSDWVHLTTRQNLELHWVADRVVRDLLADLERSGLSTRSACGHTLRNVMCSEDAGVALDEPFDCLPDAVAVSDALVARSAELNCVLPSRINIAFGGSPRCREDALINDVAFVSTVVDGVAGYRLHAGGSLGKAPALAIELAAFLPRTAAVPAAVALAEVFVAHGDFERPAKGRLKFCIEAMGADAFRAAWDQAFAAARERSWPVPAEVALLAPGDRAAAIRRRPEGGWSAGVRPQREPGLASVTVALPLGDTNRAELELLADLADRHGDGHLILGRDQDVVLRNVPVEHVAAIRAALVPRGLALLGEARDAQVRACTGSAVCALGISPAPDSGRTLLATPGLRRNSSLRVHVSGCPNSCAQHQAGDIGLAGTKVRLGGAVHLGYHLYLGADLLDGRVGEVVGRMAAEDAPAVVDAVIGTWEATRHGGETLSATVARLGLGAFTATLEAVLDDRWATGPEPDDTAVAAPRRPAPVVPAA